MCWSQIEHEYSNFGLTSAWYAWGFICWFDVFRCRVKKPGALLSFDVMSLMCLSYLRLDCTVILIYLAELTDSSIWMLLCCIACYLLVTDSTEPLSG